ncbi:hypothetical protein L798_09934 [Zootermopsis nevadensis]|uniref:Uncharacterized protein n=1 Tax=Zootermopsis nevadensis TaxID=136037 RepID=A0A067QXI8_ZOONE|nr:hypothetical protein L798_09934 [Zootermopsis nevadensis]
METELTHSNLTVSDERNSKFDENLASVHCDALWSGCVGQSHGRGPYNRSGIYELSTRGTSSTVIQTRPVGRLEARREDEAVRACALRRHLYMRNMVTEEFDSNELKYK